MVVRKTKKVEDVEVPVTVIEPVKLRWKKMGGGALRLNGQIIKPGQIFEAHKEEIPKAFLDCLICIDPEKLKQEEDSAKAEASQPEELFTVVLVEKGLYNVVNANGNPINELPLPQEEANELKVNLES